MGHAPLPPPDELATLLMNNMRDFTLILLDADGAVAGWNPGAQQLLGYHADEVLGRPIALFFTPEDRARDLPQRHIAQALQSGRAAGDTWLVRKDGSRLWASGLTMPLWDDRRQLRGFAKVIHDATARKQVEEALWESEERFRATFEQAAVGIAHVGLDGSWVRVNQKLCEIVGASAEVLLHKTFQDITHPDDLDADLTKMQQLLRGEISTYTMEKRYIREGGALIWVNLTASMVRDSDGQPSYFIAVVEDITARKQAERDLQQAHQRTIEILESISDAFYALDTEWRFSYINRRAEALWQRDRRELLGQNIWQAFPHAVGSESYQAQIQAMGEQRAITLETLSPLINSWIEVTIYPSPAGISVYFRDITARRRAEQERQQLLASEQEARRQAEDAVRTRDAFLSVASHELKTPLTALLGYAQLLERRTKGVLADREQLALGRVVEQAQRLSQMIGHLLDLSLLESGHIKMERGPIDLHALVGRVLEEMQPLLGGRAVTLRADDEPPLVVLGDWARLEQVLRNLVQNAIKYSPDNSPIALAITREGALACLAVSDQGIGIPPEAQARLFERYYRAENAERDKVSGTGIGLYVVKEIVQAHDGTVEVCSSEGQGSTFRVRLPLRDGR